MSCGLFRVNRDASGSGLADRGRPDSNKRAIRVHCQSTHSQFSARYGTSRVPWLSGTASWSHYTAIQYILGIRPEVEGLRIDPCIPTTWPGYTMTRTFRGCRLHIEVRNPSGLNRGVKSLKIDGEIVQGNLVSLRQLRDGARSVATLE